MGLNLMNEWPRYFWPILVITLNKLHDKQRKGFVHTLKGQCHDIFRSLLSCPRSQRLCRHCVLVVNDNTDIVSA